MANTQKTVDKNKNLTVISVSGKVTAEKLISILEEFYLSGATINLLWNFSNGELDQLNQHDLRKIIFIAKKYAHVRPNGKTAVVTSKKVDFGIARMFEIISETKEHPVKHHMFMSLDDALNWLEK